MTRDHIIEARQALVTQLPVTGEVLRGSLFERTVRHTSGCTICAGGGGHPLWVLTISYAGGRTRQFSLRREQVDEVRRWLGNYQAQGSARGDLRAQPRAAAAGWRRGETRQEEPMIETRRAQRTFGDGLIAEEVRDLHEGWMKHGDRVLGDKEIVAAIYEALAKRHPRGAPAAGRGPPPGGCCGCWCSSTCATGVTACWNGKCAPIWCIATSPGWAAPRCPTPRPWAVGASRWGRRRSNRSMNGSCRSRATIGWRKAGGCASRPEMADRLRGSHQHGQATARAQSQPVQGGCRNAALGRPRGDCRQPGQHQPRHRQAAQPLIPIPLTSHLAGRDLPAGPRAQIRCTVVRKRAFCAGK